MAVNEIADLKGLRFRFLVMSRLISELMTWGQWTFILVIIESALYSIKIKQSLGNGMVLRASVIPLPTCSAEKKSNFQLVLLPWSGGEKVGARLFWVPNKWKRS